MMGNYSTSNWFVSVNCTVVETQDELIYSFGCLYLIDELCFAEVTTHNIVKPNIECMLYFPSLFLLKIIVNEKRC